MNHPTNSLASKSFANLTMPCECPDKKCRATSIPVLEEDYETHRSRVGDYEVIATGHEPSERGAERIVEREEYSLYAL